MQEEVLRFLSSSSAHHGRLVKRIDTHAASVFLSGSSAFKVKRAVKFSFLDYSTLERRKRACLAEIEVNRPFAPELYVGLVRITKELDGSLKIGGDGEVAEWAVEMRRFDDTLTLDHYSENHQISDDMIRGIVRRLADVHRAASPQKCKSWLGALERFLGDHQRIFSAHPELFDARQVAYLFQRSQFLLTDNQILIEKRAKAGLLVRGHGDLHLGNIALINGEPVIFDAVEFDPLIAAGDVLYDLAFLIMDLIAEDQCNAANATLNYYLQFSSRKEHLQGLRLLPLFLSLRSAIRSVVATARYVQSNNEIDAETAKHYFKMALNFLAPEAPRLIAVGGLSGTGKSHLSRQLAEHIPPKPGAIVLRSDVYRKSLFGVSEYTKLSVAAYSEQASEIVYYSMFADAWTALAAGHSVIVDAVFRRAVERLSAEQLAGEANVQFNGLFLVTDVETRARRVEARLNDASDANREVVFAQEAHPVGTLSWTIIDASHRPKSTLTSALRSTVMSANSAGLLSANVSPMISV